MTMLTKRLLLLVILLHQANSEDPTQNLKNFVKLTSSLNPDDVTISYINGTVYSVQPGERSRKLFYFEGFNIGRKVKTIEGNYRSYSSEVVVYRDPKSGQILHVWNNTLTSKLNEVFHVSNKPVNALLREDYLPFADKLTDDLRAYHFDIPLRYPNPLQPDQFPGYSAGPWYIGSEFFEYFGRQSELDDMSKTSTNVTITWHRISQWLPWMEMGTNNGHLFFSAFSWKVPGFDHFPADLLTLLHEKFSDFLQPPADFDIPNDTTWKVFREIIVKRRTSGLPDIIIDPELVNSTRHVAKEHLHPMLKTFLLRRGKFNGTWEGNIFCFTEDLPPMRSFVMSGRFSATVRSVSSLCSYEKFIVDVDIEGKYLDPKNREELMVWENPFTNESVSVPQFHVCKTLILSQEDVVSFVIPPSNEIGLSLVTSGSDIINGKRYSREQAEFWHTSGLMAVFSQEILSANKKQPVNYYGTFSSISSWLPWMNMGNHPGYMGLRMNILPDKKIPDTDPTFPPIIIPVPGRK